MGDPAVHTPVVVHGTIRPRRPRHRAAGLHGGDHHGAAGNIESALTMGTAGRTVPAGVAALVLNFGLGPYSLYFMRETAVATRIKTLLLGCRLPWRWGR